MSKFLDERWVNVRGCAYFVVGFIAWLLNYTDLAPAMIVSSFVGLIDAGLSAIARWDGED